MDKSQKEPEKEVIQEQLSGKKALIVDDSRKNLEILNHILKRAGMRVVQMTRGDEVVAVIRNSFAEGDPVNICILDSWIPGLDGYEVAKQIRKLDSPLSNLPLLAFSSSTTTRSRKFKESGFDGFLHKPVQRKKLLQVIARLLGTKDGFKDKGKKIVTRHTIDEEAKHSTHILLAEDNPINRKLAQFMLSRAGYRVSTVNNGEEAVETFTSEPEQFDLILMDIQMPRMNGIEATQVIREKGFSDIPIIALTAQAMKGDRERCIRAGMNDYISKPLKREAVFAMVKKWCFDHPG
jgi:CheY-like chemotaxis protein